MLYVDKTHGQVSWRVRFFARVAQMLGRPRHRMADLDLVAMNPHLRRDLGMLDGPVRSDRDVRLWL